MCSVSLPSTFSRLGSHTTTSASAPTASVPFLPYIPKIFGMYGKKGTLAVGADADVVVWDPRREKVLGKDAQHMRVDYSPFEGRKVPASPSHVFSRGELIVKDDKWVGKTVKGRGQFLKRATF